MKKSPIDKKDYKFLSKNINIPEILDYRNDLQPVRNQGKQGTCYAQSVACVKEWQEKKDYGLNTYLSPQFFYNNRNNFYDNNKKNDEGMYGRDVMKLMKDIGICLEKTYPYGKIETKNNINNDVYEEAKNHIIKGYARVYKLKELKENLYLNGPCLITFPAYNYKEEFWKGTNKKGGHAVVVVGYNKEAFIIRNSWGRNWADNGYCYYKFKDWGAHWEIWTTIDEKSNVIKPEEEDSFTCCNII